MKITVSWLTIFLFSMLPLNAYSKIIGYELILHGYEGIINDPSGLIDNTPKDGFGVFYIDDAVTDSDSLEAYGRFNNPVTYVNFNFANETFLSEGHDIQSRITQYDSDIYSVTEIFMSFNPAGSFDLISLYLNIESSVVGANSLGGDYSIIDYSSYSIYGHDKDAAFSVEYGFFPVLSRVEVSNSPLPFWILSIISLLYLSRKHVSASMNKTQEKYRELIYPQM